MKYLLLLLICAAALGWVGGVLSERAMWRKSWVKQVRKITESLLRLE
jgi:hypothetical protein